MVVIAAATVATVAIAIFEGFDALDPCAVRCHTGLGLLCFRFFAKGRKQQARQTSLLRFGR